MEDPKADSEYARATLQYEMWWPAYSMAGRGSAVTASYPGYSCHSLRVIGVTAGDTAHQAFFFWSRVQLQRAGHDPMNPPDDLVSMVSFSGSRPTPVT